MDQKMGSPNLERDFPEASQMLVGSKKDQSCLLLMQLVIISFLLWKLDRLLPSSYLALDRKAITTFMN